MFGRPLRALIATLLALVLVLAACGNDDAAGPSIDEFDDPADAVLAAFSQVEAGATEYRISFDGTAADLATLMEASGEPMADDPSTQMALDLMAGAEFQVSGAGDDVAMAMILDGDAVFEMRSIGTTAYGRVDMERIIEIISESDPAAAMEFEMIMGIAPMFAMEDPRLGFITDLLEGNWVSMDVPPDSDFADLYDSTDGESIDEEVLSVLEEIIEANTSVTQSGEARGGDLFIVEVDVASALAAIGRNPLAADALELGSDFAGDPDEIAREMAEDGLASTWSFDVVITDGQISSMRMDFAELSTEAPEGASLPILIEFASSPSGPSAPSDHTPIDPDLIEELLGPMMMMGGMGDPGMGF